MLLKSVDIVFLSLTRALNQNGDAILQGLKKRQDISNKSWVSHLCVMQCGNLSTSLI